MATSTNKIKMGLKNVHYAVVTETVSESTGAIETTYGDIKKWNGAVNLEANIEGSNEDFYADDSVYATAPAPITYTGSFESALIPEDILLNVYHQTKDATTGLVSEKVDDITSYIALMFEVDGDVQKRRYIFYRVMMSRSTVKGATTEDTRTPQTDSIDFTASARPDDGLVKAFADEGSTAFANFFTAVQTPSA